MWNAKYRYKVQSVQMENFKGALLVGRYNKIKYEDIGDFRGGRKTVNERIKESILRLFFHVERIDGSWLFKRAV